MSVLLNAVSRTANKFFAYFSKEIKLLEQSEFKHLLRRFRNSRLIDVSTKEEFLELHIPGSFSCDVLSPQFATKIAMMDRSKAYFLYCRDGSRSATAMYMMQKMGFRRVYSLVSGIQKWKGTVATSIAF